MALIGKSTAVTMGLAFATAFGAFLWTLGTYDPSPVQLEASRSISESGGDPERAIRRAFTSEEFELAEETATRWVALGRRRSDKGLYWRAMARIGLGDLGGARESWLELRTRVGEVDERSSNDDLYLALAAAWGLGRTDEASRCAEILFERISWGDTELSYGQWYDMACYASLAGRYAAAMSMLEQAVGEGWRDDEWTLKDPDLWPIRGEYRFMRVVRDMQRRNRESRERGWHHSP